MRLFSIFLGLPVAFALLLAAMALMLQMDLFSADILAQAMINGVDSFPLLVIAFFLMAGEVMASGGLSTRILRLATALMGHRKGGLGYVAFFTAVLLAGLSGSAVSDAAALVAFSIRPVKSLTKCGIATSVRACPNKWKNLVSKGWDILKMAIATGQTTGVRSGFRKISKV